MILNRMRDVVDREQCEEQVDFRPKCLERFSLSEKCQEFLVPLAVSGIHFSKAFTFRQHSSLRSLLFLLDPGCGCQITEHPYDNSHCCNGIQLVYVTGSRCLPSYIKTAFSHKLPLLLLLTASRRKFQKTRTSTNMEVIK